MDLEQIRMLHVCFRCLMCPHSVTSVLLAESKMKGVVSFLKCLGECLSLFVVKSSWIFDFILVDNFILYYQSTRPLTLILLRIQYKCLGTSRYRNPVKHFEEWNSSLE